MTARGAGRWAATVLFVAFPVVITTLVWTAVSHPVGYKVVPSFSFILAPMIIFGVAIALLLRFASRREQAELRARYSTLPDRHSFVDELDWKTGEVVRTAPQPSLRPPSGDITAGLELDPIEIAHGPVGLAVRSPIAVGATVGGAAILAIAITGMLALIDTDDPSIVAYGLLSVLGFLLVLLAPLFVLTVLPQRRYRGLLAKRYPAARVWLTSAGGELRDAARGLASDDPSLPGARARRSSFIVAEPNRVTFWSRSGRRILPFLVVPRSRVSAATLDSDTDQSGSPVPAVLLTITADDGVATELKLTLGPNVALNRWSAEREMTASVEQLIRWQATGTFD